MIVVPDLFGAYQKGREAAIEANWNDLKNYEDVEAMRTRNDRDALQLLADQADYNINRSMMRDNGDVSALNAALAKERFYSDVYNARNDAMLGQAQHVATTNAAADGRLQGYANNQLINTFNNGYINQYNSGVNRIDASARYDALKASEDAFRKLTADTVGYNVRKGGNDITMGDLLMGVRNETEISNAKATRDQAKAAELFNAGTVENSSAIKQTGANTTSSNLNASRATNVSNQQLLKQMLEQPEEERNNTLAQLLDQRVLLLQNMRLAAQSGDTATLEAMAAQFGQIDADIVRLGGKSQLPLVREAVIGALGVPPSTATTQVSPTPVTQTPAVRPAPTQTPAVRPAPTTPTPVTQTRAITNLFGTRAPGQL